MKLSQILIIAGILCGLILLRACDGNITSSAEQQDEPDYESLALLLEQAYHQNSQQELDEFFSEWHEMIPAHTSRSLNALSDTVRQVYRIFQAFYSPTDLNRITGGQHENFETDFRYIVIQNDLRYAVVDTNPEYYYYRRVTSRAHEIPDFRPQHQVSMPAVYLSSGADSLLYSFLYQTDGSPRDDHQDRVEFLRQAMQLTHHHWIRDYHKATMPVVSNVYVSEAIDRALVTFRVFYQFGDAYLEYRNEEWKLIRSRLTGIE